MWLTFFNFVSHQLNGARPNEWVSIFWGIGMKKFGIMAAFAAATLAVAPANAAITIELYNTGTDAFGAALAGNGLTDTHYQIVASSHAGYVGQQAVTYNNAAWAANDADSRWISLSGNGTPVNGTTTYRLTFDLTGLDASSATISGLWAVDNAGSIALNGVATGVSLSGGATSNYSALHAFTLSSGFVAGINTLDFTVLDLGVATGLRVDSLVGTANAVPEPASWAMMIGGFGLLGGALRRKQTARLSFN
jgi:hypothetical protein